MGKKKGKGKTNKNTQGIDKSGEPINPVIEPVLSVQPLPSRTQAVDESDTDTSKDSNSDSKTECENQQTSIMHEEADNTFNVQMQNVDEILHNYLTFRDHDAHVSVNITEAILSIKESLNQLNSTMAHIASSLSKLTNRT